MRIAAPLLLLCLLLAGCPDMVDPLVEIPEEASMVVVPFGGPAFPDYFASPLGQELAVLVTEYLERNADFRVLPPKSLLSLFREGDPTELGEAEVAEKSGADYVLFGLVSEWQTADPSTVGMLRGSAKVKVKLLQRDENTFILKETVLAHYPDTWEHRDIGISRLSATEREVEEGLYRSAARRIAELFYEHEPDDDARFEGTLLHD